MNLPGTRIATSSIPQLRAMTSDQIAAGTMIVAACLAVAGGFATFASNGMDPIGIPLLALLLLAVAANGWLNYRKTRNWDRETLVIASLGLAGLALLIIAPEYSYGFEINAAIHHSFFASMALMIVGTLAAGQGIFLFLGSTPSARDTSRYPLIVLPALIVVVAYGVILGRVLDRGVGGLSLDALTSAYRVHATATEVIYEGGMRDQILGSFLLVGMTLAISLPIGIGTGMYLSEYPGKIARVIALSTQLLRAISLFIIGAAAVNTVLQSSENPSDLGSQFIRGTYQSGGFAHPALGSFLLASCFVSLLVIPVIARATEEGLRSVPREVREGSLALGATDGHALLNIFMPWAFPIIVTGILVGAAEAAGATAILIFVSGTGEHGVGPLHETTTLDTMIYWDRFGSKQFMESMGKYQYTAAILLLFMTLSLTSIALWIKARAWKRYKGVYS